MKTAFGPFLLFVVLNLIFLGVVIGIGALLHWLIPAIDLGAGALLGAASAIASGWFLVQAVKMAEMRTIFEGVDEDEEYEDYEDDDEF